MDTKLICNDPVVFHFRIGTGEVMSPKAGATVVFLPEQRRFGLAMCCEKDRYDKKWGRHVATLRAQVGDGARKRRRRFLSWRAYDGPMEMMSIRRIALAMVQEASGAVDNPVFSAQLNPWAGQSVPWEAAPT